MIATPADPLIRLQSQMRVEVERIAKTLKADIVTSFVYDERTARFGLPTGYGLHDPDTFHHPRMGPWSGRVAGMVARERRPIVVEQVRGQTPMDGPFARRERVESAAGYPLLTPAGQAVGVLFVSHRSPHHFTPGELETIQREADRLADVIVRADPFEEVRRASEPGSPGNGSGAGNMTLQNLVELTCDSMNLAVGIWQVGPDRALALVAGYGLTSGYWHDAWAKRPRIGDGSWFDGVAAGGEVRLDDARDDGRFPYRDRAAAAEWVSALGLPIWSHGRVCGVVEGLSFGGFVDPVDECRLRRLAELAQVTLEWEAEERIQARVVKESRQARTLQLALTPILEGAMELTGAASGGINLVDLDGTPFALSAPAKQAVAPVRAGRGADGARVDVPIRVGYEEIGTLYVCGAPGGAFTDRDRGLLGTLAAQIAVALGMPRRLLWAIREIWQKTAQLPEQKRVFREVVNQLRGQGDSKFDFASLHLIRPGEDVIEGVCGVERANEWEGRAKHYLEVRPQIRDIDADIAQPPLRVEVITRNDPKGRFDQWIFETFKHHKFVRAFVPVVLARDADGKVLDGEDLADWIGQWATGPTEVTKGDGGRCDGVPLRLPERLGGRAVRTEVLGTFEAGYEDCEASHISVERAFDLARRAARLAPRLYRTHLECLFQTVVDHAVRLFGAKYASLHFYPTDEPDRPDRVRYIYEVSSGDVREGFLQRNQPRNAGLGCRAIRAGKALVVPDPTLGHADDQLKFDNPAVYAEGISAMAAVPLRLGRPLDPLSPAERDGPDAANQGVLYVGFGNGLGGIHRFTAEEIDSMELYSDSIAQAIRQATAFTRAQDEARLLTNLQEVAKSLVSIPEDPDKLKDIAWNVLNVLGADVVTIYQYDAASGDFRTPPAIAGRLLEPRVMEAKVSPMDSPAWVLKQDPLGPVYAETSASHPLLDPPRPAGSKRSFVAREGIRSTAAVPLVVAKGTALQETVGILFVNYRRPRSFPDDQKKVIESLASAAAVAIKNGRLLEVSWETAHDMIAPQDVDELLRGIVKRAVDYTHAASGEVRLFDPLRERMQCRCQYPSGAGGDEADHPARAVEEWVMRVAAAWAREAAAAPDKVRPCPTALVHAYDRFEPCKGSGDGISGSEFCVPLLHKERCLGVLRVRHPKEGTFWPWQETVLKGLADRAVLALLTHDVQEKLRTNEKIATLGGLYATLLHRLRNDVRAIRTYAQLAEEDYAQVAADEAGTDAAAAHLDKLTRLAGTILEQVDRISQWTKTDRQLVDVRGAIERGLAKAGATAELDVPDRLPRVSADPELLAEVFGILAKNGVEAMPEGGRLRIAAEHRGPWVVVRVRDTGTGIDALTMRTLFQPKHSSKGLGIGLWLAHSYAELIGGRLDVDTEPGVGSTFILGLPTPPNAPPAGDPHE